MFKILKRVLQYARPYIKYCIMGVVFAAVGVSLSLAVPVFIGEAIDRCTGKGKVDFQGLFKIVTVLGSIIAASTLFQWMMCLCTNKLAFLTIRDLRNDIFNTAIFCIN